MGLQPELISQFAKIVNNNKKQNTESTVYGTIITDGNGNKYVKLDGSDQLTPIGDDNRPTVDSTTANANEGDRVSVLIKNHTATVTGNISSPAVRNDDFKELDDQVTDIKNFDIVIADRVQATEAHINELKTDKLSVGEFEAAKGEIEELVAGKAEVEELNAAKAEITDLKSTKIDADVVLADNAILEKLKATNADILSLIADKATVEDLIANKASINSLLAEKLDVTWANIDFSDIDMAVIGELFTTSGIIKDLTTESGTVTGELVGVTIKGALIEAGTLQADKLVIRNSKDGLYYKLNIDAGAVVSEVVTEDELQNGLHGDTIIAKTITAEKVSVSDLVAFDATIGRFHISENLDEDSGSIYSGTKLAIDSPNPGIYLGSDGQLNFGDTTNFIKYYKDENGNYKLAISAESIVYSLNGQSLAFKDIVNLTDAIAIGKYNDEPCIILSQSGSDFKLLITNTRIIFTDGASVPAYITNESLNIGKAIIENELQVGSDDDEDGTWVWKKRANGNIGLQWKGVST